MKIQHVYQTSYKTVNQPPGFADFITGTMSLYCFNDDEVYVNYQNHPISLFLENLYHQSSNDLFFDDNVVELFNFSQDEVLNQIKNINKPTKISTNSRGYVLSKKLKEFIINSFKPNKNLQEEIDSKIKQFDLYNFDTVHIRLGDYNMHKSSNDYKQIFKKIFSEKYFKNNIFVTSDNKDIKDFLHQEFSNVKIINNNPVHLGDLLNSKTLEQDVKDTLLDFYIMSKTNNAYCYSVYGGSGFSHRCSEIFDFTYEIKQIC
jgi:hypothetical protein